MKVYIDARLSWRSGIGRFVASVVPFVVQRRPKWGFRIAIAPTNDHPVLTELERLPNVELAVTDCAPFSLKEQTSLEAIAKGCDISWFTNYWVPFVWRTPFIATIHDLLHLQPRLFPTSVANRILSRLAFQKLARRAEGLMFVSRFTHREFVDRFGSPRRSTIVHHGVDAGRFAAAGDKTKMLLVVSALKSHKNLEMLVNTWKQAQVSAEWRLMIVHPGDTLRSSIWRDGIPQIVNATIAGGVTDDELASLYSSAALFLFPSKYEGFGLPLLEAASSGCRILSSTAPALIETAEGMQVWHIDAYDAEGWRLAIEKHCREFDRLGQFPETAANAEIASRVTWTAAANSIIAFLESL